MVRLLRGHPQAAVAFTTGSDGGHLAHEAGLEREADAYFLALPHGVSAHYAARLRERRPRGGRRRPVGRPAPAHGRGLPRSGTVTITRRRQLLGQASYGLTEVFRDRLPGARLISNPGCYATSVLLPLLPLLRERLVDAADIVVDAKSGATGAGRSLREDLLFCELADNFSAYSPGRTHRHVGEIEAAPAGAPRARRSTSPSARTCCP